MTDRERIIRHIEENIRLKKRLLNEFTPVIETCAARVTEALRRGGKLLLCGNGGSAADARHLAAEFVVRLRSGYNRAALPALALSVDTSVLTAAGNDLGYAAVFARQIEAPGNSGDLLPAFTTSGNSENVIEAARAARQKSVTVIGMSGGTGGKLTEVSDIPLMVPSSVTARIQETHILIGHIICECAETGLFYSSENR